MKIFLDDERPAPERSPHGDPSRSSNTSEPARVTHLGLDHDLTHDRKGAGHDVLLWLEREVAAHRLAPPELAVHSANSSAREKMKRAIQNIRKLAQRQAWIHGRGGAGFPEARGRADQAARDSRDCPRLGR